MEASKKSEAVTSFLAMDVLERAKEMESAGKRIIHFELGEPGFDTPRVIAEAGIKAIRDGKTKYTHSLGTPELREEICAYFKKECRVTVEPERVIVTNGSSAALFLAFAALLDAGDEVILGDPHYACYPNYISFLDGVPVFVPVREAEGFQLLPRNILKAVSHRTKAVLINSPANPTGAVLQPDVLAEIAAMGFAVISDEVYHGLSYGARARSILEHTDHAFVVGGFSKRYAMTGWRIGYAIAPKDYMRPMQKLQQNFQISPGAISQEAALVALRKGGKDAERMKKEYAKRRKLMVDGLRRIGFKIPFAPQGAFYVFASCSFLEVDSLKLAHRLLDEAGVAVTPGIDFGKGGEGYLRFSYAAEEKEIKEGLKRLGAFVKRLF